MGLVGEGAIVTTVLPDVFPVIELENQRAELYKLGGISLAAGGENRAPGAANRATMGFTNPANSGVVATVTRYTFNSSAPQNVIGGWIGFPNTITSAGVNRIADGRQNNYPNELPICFTGTSITDPINAAWFNYAFAADEFYTQHDLNGIVVLGPGTTWGIRGGTNNITVRWAVEWRERPAEPSEFV